LGHGNKTSIAEPKQIIALSSINVKQIACGRAHSLALGVPKSVTNGSFQIGNDTITTKYPDQGFVFSWGSGESGRLGQNNAEDILIPTLIKCLSDKNSQLVSCGELHSVVVCDNHAYSFGSNEYGQLGTGDKIMRMEPYLVELESNIKKIGCGSMHSMAVLQNGDIYSWGLSNKGQLGVGQITDCFLKRSKHFLDPAILCLKRKR
jgi:alpha-tubulin suppressor-like RCC1 family protein